MSTAPGLHEPRPVTAWELEKALLEALRDLEELPASEITGELEELVAELIDGAVDKRDALAGAFKRRLADVEALEARAADAKAKAERAAKSLDSFKSYLLSLIELRNGEPLAGVQYTIKRQQNPARVELDPTFTVSAETDDLFRHIPERWEPNKPAIAGALKAGEVVPGARLVPGDWRVVIR